MISYRAFTKRFGAQRAVESLTLARRIPPFLPQKGRKPMSGLRDRRSGAKARPRVLRAAIASLGLAALLGGLWVPLLGLVLADEPAPFCCAKGRGCCAEAAAGEDERPCLRRGCGCGHEDATVDGAPLQIEAVLPAASLLAIAPPSDARWEARSVRTIPRVEDPPAPPPRRSLST
jgi:hypothetical protein